MCPGTCEHTVRYIGLLRFAGKSEAMRRPLEWRCAFLATMQPHRATTIGPLSGIILGRPGTVDGHYRAKGLGGGCRHRAS